MAYYGSDYIYNVLSNDATVTGLVSTSIYNSRKIPETDTSSEVINYYRESPVNNALDYGDYTYTINCRASTEITAGQIADAVSSALNRVHTNVSGAVYFGIVSILPPIPPVEDGDTFNIPVTLQIKSKE